MGPADYHSSTGLDAGNACSRNGDQDHGHHPSSQPPESATFASARVRVIFQNPNPYKRVDLFAIVSAQR